MDSDPHAGAPGADSVEENEEGGEPQRESTRRRPGRRARTAPPPGSDPTPAPEPPRHASTENDSRLRTDKPPHY